MSSFEALEKEGQAVWLDFLARKFVASGGLEKLVKEDGVTGVTSNPSIFQKAIADSSDYDSSIEKALKANDYDAMALYEQLAIEDIQNAAKVLLPVYEKTEGKDGFVSLEVSPYLAMDTAATIFEAKRLWKAVGCKNVMIKVPATEPSLPAIRELIAEGINVNVTLIFSQDAYEKVVEAYLSGLEALKAKGGDITKVASVASFFVSRIDVAVEKMIQEQVVKSPKDKEKLEALAGKVAISNAKLAYQRYKKLFQGARWERLQAAGGHVQRVLWASTATKNKAYSDVLYVEELIAADTVNTMPPETVDAFRDHGKVRKSLEENVPMAEAVMKDLETLGISIDKITDKLVKDGVQLFADAFDKLLGAVARKRILFRGDSIDAETHKLPEILASEVQASLEAWRSMGNVRRLWSKDATLWTSKDEAKWLDWLTITDKQREHLESILKMAASIRSDKFSHVLLLGMGGSSLGPEVFAETFKRNEGFPELLVLDSTDPQQIKSFEKKIDLAKTLFIVSSKSGSTLEPNILKQYFFERAKSVLGDNVGSHFIAVTDPGSKMQEVAKEGHFRGVGLGEPGIGGRYSVLSDFGIVPAAAMGLDIKHFLMTTDEMVKSCSQNVPPADNPGVVLGTVLGVAGKAGHDKVTLVASPGIADFGAWLEQLLAESTGKLGKGLVPVDAEPLAAPEFYGKDRIFAYMRLKEGFDVRQDDAIAALEKAGHPVIRIMVQDRMHIGQEFFRWEIATAVAGAILQINPFDQPDVEASKIKTKELTTAYEKTGALPPETPFFEGNGVKLFADDKNKKMLEGTAGNGKLEDWLKAHFERLGAGDYCGLLAYIERNKAHTDLLRELRVLIRDRKKSATVVGFGPRFLHSTGQAYKGGPNSGVFLQITADDAADLPVPGQTYTFGVVKAAQARGDFEVLAERGRRLLRVHLGQNVEEGLKTLTEAIKTAMK